MREVLPDVPILLDVPGRKVRTGRMPNEPVFANGDIVVLTTESGDRCEHKVPVDYPSLHEDLAEGDTILADDGTLRFHVEKVVARDIVCRAETGGVLRSRKGINVPHVALRSPLITHTDRAMLELVKHHKIRHRQLRDS